ncbi:phosphotransferase [Paenibacillus sp. FSL W8-1187]|uniref:phosphotransferase n=1 Tax=Paenibacillus sp. FSL W8-1187 TaxID=2975339 RepID=UPI0030DCCF70
MRMMESWMSRLWPEWSGTLRRRSGGWNNSTYFMESRAGRAVLRIYETHRDRDKIEFEHEVLKRLAELSLPFQVPQPIPARNGATVAETEDEPPKLACLFRYIEGDSPAEEESGYEASFGEAAGLLSAALAGVRPSLSPAYRPYYELRAAYPLCTDEALRELCLEPPEPFRHLAAELGALYEACGDIFGRLAELERLPHQLVHGDLNASNLLLQPADRRQVAALLDFEFCTWDLRAMEPAVVLSGLVGHPEEEAAAQAFWRGFSGVVRLSREEMEAVPLLMQLRKADVFLHFVSRFWEGTDEAPVLREQVRMLAADLGRLSSSSRRMMRMMRGGE